MAGVLEAWRGLETMDVYKVALAAANLRLELSTQLFANAAAATQKPDERLAQGLGLLFGVVSVVDGKLDVQPIRESLVSSKDSSAVTTFYLVMLKDVERVKEGEKFELDLGSGGGLIRWAQRRELRIALEKAKTLLAERRYQDVIDHINGLKFGGFSATGPSYRAELQTLLAMALDHTDHEAAKKAYVASALFYSAVGLLAHAAHAHLKASVYTKDPSLDYLLAAEAIVKLVEEGKIRGSVMRKFLKGMLANHNYAADIQTRLFALMQMSQGRDYLHADNPVQGGLLLIDAARNLLRIGDRKRAQALLDGEIESAWLLARDKGGNNPIIFTTKRRELARELAEKPKKTT